MDRVSEIAGQCIECSLCSQSCPFLSELECSPKRLAEQGGAAEIAFSCALCGRCEAVCPSGLSPMELFAAGRRLAVGKREFVVEEYRYMLPDRPNHLMNVYRHYAGIDYCDIEIAGTANTAFFPGCTLMTYAPGLTREIYARLNKTCECGGLFTACCGKPLALLGLQQRADNAVQELVARLRAFHVRELIIACPGCYYYLREPLRAAGIVVRTVYEVLAVKVPAAARGRVCTVHDSCPDRFEGIFGSQVREMLGNNGFALTEMDNNREMTICCGSGGMISHFRPDLTKKLVSMRLSEAQKTKADMLVTYCISCALKFAAGFANGPAVEHALCLLVGRSEDFSTAKAGITAMLEGPQGTEIWKQIMAD